jgi:hypothetical protein
MRRLPYLMACISHRLVVAVRHRAIRTWVGGELRPARTSLTPCLIPQPWFWIAPQPWSSSRP